MVGRLDLIGPGGGDRVDRRGDLTMALLDVRDLRVSFDTDDGTVFAVQGMSFSVEPGKTLGIVGESGSGKSVCTQAIMGLAPGARVSGQALLDGADLLSMSEHELE